MKRHTASFGPGRRASNQGSHRNRRPAEAPQGPPRDARDAVGRRLLQIAASPDAPDIAPLDLGSLSQRDAALARALYRSATSRWLTLAFLLGRHTRQPWRQLDPPTRAGLILGGAQLLFLGGIAPHAALNETVNWVKTVQPRSSGIVNAVLRKLSKDVVLDASGAVTCAPTWNAQRDELPLGRGGSIRLSGAILPEPLDRRLEAATGVPRWQVARWLGSRDEADVIAACAHTLIEPPIVLRTAHATRPLPEGLAAHDEPGHHVLSSPPDHLQPWLEAHGGVWVQDASSSRAIADNTKLTPGCIVDLCAGQGTKTRQLAATFGESEIIATDTDDRRRATLRAAFEGHERVRVIEPGELRTVVERRADLVLADVPCTNSGVLARRAEARLRLGQAQLSRLIDQQRDILAVSVSILADGGRVLYATCSLDDEENGAQARWAERALGLTLEGERVSWPEGTPGGPAGAYLDGAYWALLRLAGPQGSAD